MTVLAFQDFWDGL